MSTLIVRHSSTYRQVSNIRLGLNILRKDNCKPRWETFKFWDLVWLVLEILWYIWDFRVHYPLYLTVTVVVWARPIWHLVLMATPVAFLTVQFLLIFTAWILMVTVPWKFSEGLTMQRRLSIGTMTGAGEKKISNCNKVRKNKQTVKNTFILPIE